MHFAGGKIGKLKMEHSVEKVKGAVVVLSSIAELDEWTRSIFPLAVVGIFFFIAAMDKSRYRIFTVNKNLQSTHNFLL
jgi:hypothetical protein